MIFIYEKNRKRNSNYKLCMYIYENTKILENFTYVIIA